ncbi:TPA: FecCD family ABC transporter permease [Streptococcus suis]
MFQKQLGRKNRELVSTSLKASLAPFPLFFLLLLFLLAGCYWGLRLGAISYSHNQMLSVLKEPLVQSDLQDILIDLRLPRILAAGLVGASLATSGTIMQAVTRNRLADPGLLGIPAGAGLFLILKMIFFPDSSEWLTIFACLLGASLAAFLIIYLSQQNRKNKGPLHLILAGIMVTAIMQALGQGIALLHDMSNHIVGLEAGSLTSISWRSLFLLAPFIFIGLMLAQIFAHSLTILSLDDTVATALGQDTQKMTVFFLAIVVLLSASSVSLVGSLSFVGLIIPNLLTALLPKDYRYILPFSSLAGAGFLIWVDLVSRTLHPPYETPLSTLISFIGLPIFLLLIRKGNFSYEK